MTSHQIVVFAKLRERFPRANLGMSHLEAWTIFPNRPGSNREQWCLYIDNKKTPDFDTLDECLAHIESNGPLLSWSS